MPHVRSPHRLDSARSALLLIDFQVKLAPLVLQADAVERQILRLTRAAKLMGVPTAATVQYPQGLGPLVTSLEEEFPNAEEKRAFSAAVCRRALDAWAVDGRDQIVVLGIETHVCVQQTVFDLIAEGMRPFVVGDAVSARDENDHQVALQRMRDNGATLTTSEAVMFEWLETSDRPEFKPISAIIKS